MHIKIGDLSKEKIYEIIDKVSKNHRNKNFGSYTREDIEQQCWIIALEKLPQFNVSKKKEVDLSRALENWLNTILARRLSNFYRDKFLVPLQIKKRDANPQLYRERQALFYPKTISSADNLVYKLTEIDDHDFWDSLLGKLKEDEKMLLDSLLSGETLNAYYKSKIIRIVKEFMVEYGEQVAAT